VRAGLVRQGLGIGGEFGTGGGWSGGCGGGGGLVAVACLPAAVGGRWCWGLRGRRGVAGACVGEAGFDLGGVVFGELEADESAASSSPRPASSRFPQTDRAPYRRVRAHLIIRPNSCSGIWQPCHPARSLNVPQRAARATHPHPAKNCPAHPAGAKSTYHPATAPANPRARPAYTNCRAEGTRISSRLNVKFFGSFTK